MPRGATASRVLLAISGGLLVAFAVQGITGVGGAAAQNAFGTWVSDAIMLAVLAVCGWRALVEPDDRATWALATLGLASWAGANVYYTHTLAAGGSITTPSVVDVFFLGFYPAMYLAVLALMRRHDRHPGVSLWLDAVIGGAACAAVGAELVVEPVLEAARGEPLDALLTNLAYPIGDVLLLAMLVVTIATVGWRGATGLVPLAAGMALFSVFDSVYLVQEANGSYALGALLDTGWLLALVVIALGATMLPRCRALAGRPRLSRPIVPTAAALVALAILARESLNQGDLGAPFAILTLCLVVVRLALSLRETERLLAERARDAVTDALTGLGNRRQLLVDLEAAVATADERSPVLIVLFDLDSFKAYNDTFGHPAGDALLIRIGAMLQDAVGGRGRAYRLGGDEFCALLGLGDASSERVGAELAAAMDQRGEGFAVLASHGCAVAPRDGHDPSLLLRLADDEMYLRKGNRRAGAERQVQDALLAALRERDPALQAHSRGVAGLATAVGRRMGLGAGDTRALTQAASLHDIGKIAVPEGILAKPAPLDTDEWDFVRTHPLIAQRILSAAPALSYVARLVRSTQERWDGNGYPDGLAGEEIPLSARIISVCNAYLAMTSERPFKQAQTEAEALAELRRCAGSQFDTACVDALVEVLEHNDEQLAHAS